jgi:hypothetical protein
MHKPNHFRLLDTDRLVASVNTFSLNLQDHEMLTPTVARVVLTFSGRLPIQEEIRASINNLFKGKAQAIANSFRNLERSGSKSIVGFVRSAAEIKEYVENAETAGRYVQTASNLLMDNVDKSMWEVRSGATGKYLVRKGEDDLSELVHMAHAKKSGAPTLAQIASVPPELKEYACFVDLVSEDLMHGFVVGRNGEVSTVACKENDGETCEVQTAQLVEVMVLSAEDEKASGMRLAESAASKADMKAYYKKVYSYAPDYVREIDEIIDQHAVA